MTVCEAPEPCQELAWEGTRFLTVSWVFSVPCVASLFDSHRDTDCDAVGQEGGAGHQVPVNWDQSRSAPPTGTVTQRTQGQLGSSTLLSPTSGLDPWGGPAVTILSHPRLALQGAHSSAFPLC